MQKSSLEDLAGYREIAALMRSQFVSAKETADGLATPLGAIETWSPGLRSAFAILLNSGCPMFLVWDCGLTQNCSGERILFYNDAYLSLLKEIQPLTVADQSQDNWTESWRTLQAAVEQVFTTGQALRREQNPFLIDRNGNGNGPLYNWSYSAVWDEAGQIRGVFATGCQVLKEEIVATATVEEGCFGLVSNSSDRKKLEQERERFLSVGSDLLVITGIDGSFQWVSPTFERTLGWTVAEMTSRPWTAFVHPDDVGVSVLETDHLFSGNETIAFENRYRHKDGSYRWFLWNARPYPEEQVIYGAAVDITERKQAEATLQAKSAELQHVTETVGVGLTRCSRDWRYLSANAAYAHLAGMDVEAIVGRPIVEVMGEAALETIRPYVERVLGGERVEYEAEVPFTAGGVRSIHVVYTPDKDGKGKIIGWIASVIDITKRKQAEEALRQSEEQLRLAQRAAGAGLWDWDIVADRATWSEEFYRLYGLDPMVTPSYNNWLALVLDVDRDRVAQAARAALEHRVDLNVEFRIFHPIHGERWLTEIGQTFYAEDGQPKRMVGIALDITDRKRAEAALRESEARFQAIVRNVPGMLYRYTSHPDGSDTFTYVSEGALELLELEPETVIQDSSSIWALFHPDDLPGLRESVAVVVENLLPWQWEGRLLTPSGQLKWIQGRSRPQQTAQGMVWDGLLIDITERKQAEQALRRSEEWARLAIHVGRLGGWRLHLETNLVEMDERMREIWGEPSDAVMVPLPKVIERMHPDDRVRVTHAVNAALDPHASGTYEIDYRIVWHDGTERWVLAKGQAQFEGKGEARRAVDFFGTLLDITDRKHVEETLRNSAERLSLALTAAKLGDWSWHIATDIVTLSEQAAVMFSLPSGPHMTWAQMQALLHVDDRERARLQVEQAIADHSDYDIEYRVMQPDGTKRWIAAKGRAQYDLSGQVLGMLGVVQDVTQRKQADAEREQLLVRAQVAREEAERANRIKDEFLAVLSHELRSPLNPILGWSKLLQQSNLDATRTAKALETIERNAKLQAQLIDDLLDISRILQGKLTLTTLPVSLSFVLTAAIDTVRLAIDAKAIQLKLAVDPAVGQVLGDAARLQQVVWNLLANAAKFTPSGGQITVSLTQEETCAQLQVKDTGKGIHPMFLPSVFEHFRQEDGATTRQFGGLGLGLAIVRQIVEMHGGSVQAESPGEGLGATFTVKLPLTKTGSNQAQTIRLDSPAVDLKGLQVLVVDDEADMREIAAFVLEQQGAVVSTAASAQEALTALDRFTPDVLLSDIGMPDMDGYMLIQQVRSRAASDGGQIPAIALTAYAGEVDQQQALAAGFQQHLAKPIEPMILIEAIASLLNESPRKELKP
ncbi:MAG: PAS domain-containing protein [Stenomitos frigidus ULC029]